MSDSIEKPFAPNPSIDAAVLAMLPAFSSVSQGRMKKAIRDAAKAAEKHRDENTDSAARHIFREFIPASLLNRFGYHFEYNHKLHGLTPDWCDLDSGFLMESYTFERGFTSTFMKRVRSSINTKCARYVGLTERYTLRFVVAVYLDIATGVDFEYCLSKRAEFLLIFEENPNLWGILFFTEGTVWGPSSQPYGFFCIAADDSFKKMERWKFQTISVFA